MIPNSTKQLKHYFTVLYQHKNPLFCPLCNKSVLAKQFENHVFKSHGIDGKTRCVWCQNISWRKSEKHKHKQHLLDCFRKFVKSKPSNSHDTQLNEESTSPLNSNTASNINGDSRQYNLLDMTHEFPEKDFFGHQMTHPDPMFGQTLEEFLNIPASPLPTENLPPLPVAFADDNLNLAASCVLFYLENRDTHDFFHVMVRLLVYESFLEAMERDSGNSHTLPFSCWCDGGKYQEPHYRQHRHAIIVSSKGHFRKNVWPKIKLARGTRLPKPKYPCKTLKVIDSPRYLVNTIGYLSRRKSRCNFSFKKNAKRVQDNHFYLYRTLPKQFKLHLFLLWEDGVLELLKQTKFQNVSVAELAQGVLFRNPVTRQWTQKIKDFYKLKRGLVANVARDYIPTNETTPHFLHLEKNGRKIYFHKSPENRNLDHPTWLQKQVEGGNCFYEAVEECTWVPRPRDQKVLNFHKPVVDRCRELETKVEEQLKEWNREKEELIRENKSLRLKLEELQASREEMRIKMQQLMEQIIQYKDEEINRLRLENDTQKHEIGKLRQENDKLKQLINLK